MNLRRVTLLASDLPSLRDFYSRTLGLPAASDDAGTLVIDVGESALCFDAVETTPSPVYHVAMNIPENRLEQARSWLSARVPLLDGPDGPVIHFRSWNAHSLYFRDPAGNVVEFIARHNLPNATTDSFTSRALLNVSEVGLPVRNVPKTADVFRDTLDIPRWSQNDDTFAAVGDEDGLFILVSETHTWYPINLPVGAFPVHVLIDGRTDRTVRIPGTPYVVESMRP